MKNKLAIINGPNLHKLGKREVSIYDCKTLDEVNQDLEQIARRSNFDFYSFQSNAEHEIINFIYEAKDENIDFIIINPAAFTHTSIAIRDALLAVSVPFIEVHITNIYKREPFRHLSYFSDCAVGVISGLGWHGYKFALELAIDTVLNKKTKI